MKYSKLAAAALVAMGVMTPVMAAPNWVGTATYGPGAETVGPFNTYDFSSAGVMLLDPQSATTFNGYYQSSVTQHLLDGVMVDNPKLAAGDYEVTIAADFSSQLTSHDAFGDTFAVQGGKFALWLDTTPDRDFNADSGFIDGTKILEGIVVGGAGSTVTTGALQNGGGSLQLQVTNYDSSIFSPQTLAGGETIFTLRLNSPVDAAFVDPITSVQGHAYMPGTGDLKYVADGNVILTVPEADQYAMLLAGLGIMGLIARRRTNR